MITETIGDKSYHKLLKYKQLIRSSFKLSEVPFKKWGLILSIISIRLIIETSSLIGWNLDILVNQSKSTTPYIKLTTILQYIFSSTSIVSIFLVVKMEKWRIWDLYCSFLINYLSSALKFLKLIHSSHFLTLSKLCLIFRMFNQNERIWLVDWSVTYTIYHRVRQEMTDRNMRKRNSLWNTWYGTRL